MTAETRPQSPEIKNSPENGDLGGLKVRLALGPEMWGETAAVRVVTSDQLIESWENHKDIRTTLLNSASTSDRKEYTKKTYAGLPYATALDKWGETFATNIKEKATKDEPKNKEQVVFFTQLYSKNVAQKDDFATFTSEDAQKLYKIYFTGVKAESQIDTFVTHVKEIAGDALEEQIKNVLWLTTMFGEKSQQLIKAQLEIEAELIKNKNLSKLAEEANKKLANGKLRGDWDNLSEVEKGGLNLLETTKSNEPEKDIDAKILEFENELYAPMDKETAKKFFDPTYKPYENKPYLTYMGENFAKSYKEKANRSEEQSKQDKIFIARFLGEASIDDLTSKHGEEIFKICFTPEGKPSVKSYIDKLLETVKGNNPEITPAAIAELKNNEDIIDYMSRFFTFEKYSEEDKKDEKIRKNIERKEKFIKLLLEKANKEVKASQTSKPTPAPAPTDDQTTDQSVTQDDDSYKTPINTHRYTPTNSNIQSRREKLKRFKDAETKIHEESTANPSGMQSVPLKNEKKHVRNSQLQDIRKRIDRIKDMQNSSSGDEALKNPVDSPREKKVQIVKNKVQDIFHRVKRSGRRGVSAVQKHTNQVISHFEPYTDAGYGQHEPTELLDAHNIYRRLKKLGTYEKKVSENEYEKELTDARFVAERIEKSNTMSMVEVTTTKDEDTKEHIILFEKKGKFAKAKRRAKQKVEDLKKQATSSVENKITGVAQNLHQSVEPVQSFVTRSKRPHMNEKPAIAEKESTLDLPILPDTSIDTDNVASSLESLKAFAEKDTLESKESYEKSLEAVMNVLEKASGIVEIRGEIPTIVVPDLHARRDFLVKVMDHEVAGQKVYDLLKEGKINVVCSGNGMQTIKKEQWSPDDIEPEMQQSLGTMKMVMDLKRLYPEYFHYVRGNQDDTDIRIQVVETLTDEGVLHVSEYVKKWIVNNFGRSFSKKMGDFEAALPLLAKNKDLLITHAAPNKALTEEEIKVKSKETSSTLMCSRITNESKNSIQKTRENLGISEQVPWIVGRYIITEDHNEGRFAEIDGTNVYAINSYTKEPVLALIPNDRSFEPDKDIQFI